MVDFNVNNQGTIFLLTPLTEAAELWVEDHLSHDCQIFGLAIVIEHRYIDPIIEGIRAEGLEVEEQ